MIRPAREPTSSAGGGPTRTIALRNDRPPVLGLVGRETGWACFTVCPDTTRETLQPVVTEGTAQEATLFTDENRSYLWLKRGDEPREHKAIDHSEAWAEDRDGDGHREVHVNTIEGIWTSLRNRLRLFRGVHKEYLSGYVAMFELAYNHDRVTPAILQRMCGV